MDKYVSTFIKIHILKQQFKLLNYMEACKNCKYWGVSEYYPVKNAEIGKCNRVKLFWDATKWGCSDDPDDWDSRVLRDENKNDKAFVQDGSDYQAFLLTLGDFGCNQFENK